MVVKRAFRSGSIVAGGGAVEMEVSRYLKDYALTIEGKGQMIVSAFAKALEVVPQQLSDNAGFDSTDILSSLRRCHAEEGSAEKWFGVDVKTGSVCDTFESGVWEPSDNKSNSINAAVEAACVILSIDETIIAPKSQDPNAHHSGMMGGGGGGGGGMSNMMGNAMQAAQGGARSGQLGQGVSYMKGRGGG